MIIVIHIQLITTNRTILFIFVAFLQQEIFVHINYILFLCKKNLQVYLYEKEFIFSRNFYVCIIVLSIDS